MPRNKSVYGKRPKTNTVFATSHIFAWSSPAKADPATLSTIRPDDDVVSLANKFNNIALGPVSLDKERDRDLSIHQEKEGRALKAKDANIVVKTKKPSYKSKEERAVVAGKAHLIAAQEHQKHDGFELSEEREAVLKQPSLAVLADKETLTKASGHRKIKIRTKEISQSSLYTSHGTATQTPPSPTIFATSCRTVPAQLEAFPSPLPLHQRPAQPAPPVPSTQASRPPNPLAAYTAPLLHLSSDPDARSAPIPFSTWSAGLEPYFSITKIAEASYGEVYRLSLKEARPGFSKADESVLKLIALRPPPPSAPSTAAAPTTTQAKDGGRGKKTKEEKAQEAKLAMMSTVPHVRSEVLLLQRMTCIPGFTNFRDVRVLQGRPSAPFVSAWKCFNGGRRKSQKSVFPDPGRKGSYGEEQLWAVIEMQDAGRDLENVRVRDVWGCWDVFWGVALALGKGEEGARFEHRDLHLGNICVRSAREEGAIEAPEIRNVRRKLGYTGMETTIIDYTLSRAEMVARDSSDGGSEEQVAYLDLEEDQALFEGDGAVEYQYDIYRYMRAAMYLDEPLADVDSKWDEAVSTGRTWKGYHPQTNLVWLHFVLYNLLEQMRWPSEHPEAALERLDVSEDRRLAADRAAQLEEMLSKLQGLLDLGNLPLSGLTSIRDLIGLALSEGWLNDRDVIGVPFEDMEGSKTKQRKPQRRKIARA